MQHKQTFGRDAMRCHRNVQEAERRENADKATIVPLFGAHCLVKVDKRPPTHSKSPTAKSPREAYREKLFSHPPR